MAKNKRVRGVSASLLTVVVGAAMGLTWTPVVATGEAAATSVDGDREIDMEALKKMMEAKAGGEKKGKKKKGKSWKDVSDGFTKVTSTQDGKSLYGVWINKETNQVLAELPRGYASQKQFFAMTVAGGEIFAGLQAGDRYLKWKKINDRMALVAPQIAVRSTGDQQSKDSVKMIFTDRVFASMPIVCDGPGGQPVIDLDGLLVGNAVKFFGRSARGLDSSLTTVTKVKSFPQNVEIEFTGPVAGGTMKTFHYSLSKIQGTPGYKPREADQRVGYFTTSYQDFGKFDWKDTNIRYINRWNLEKRDKKLRLSPPKEPIVYYIEHTVPVRYRRWVKQGVEQWNKAYEQIGIDGAIEVRFQDKSTGAHMEKDPEDVRYNFIRWLSNDVATAIGPSRVNPETGEILDADVVLTDGWLRVFTYRWDDLMPDLATEGMSPDTIAWLDRNPKWDPRVRLAAPQDREAVIRKHARLVAMGSCSHPLHQVNQDMLGDDEYDGLVGRVSQVNGLCQAQQSKALGLATMRMYLEAFEAFENSVDTSAKGDKHDDDEPAIDDDALEVIRKQIEDNPQLEALLPARIKALLAGEDAQDEDDADDDEGEEESEDSGKKNGKAEDDDEPKLDGIPEWFVGPALAELVAHEVGHTLGLRHNFKGSSYYSFDEINSDELKDDKPMSMSVMDYNGVNIRMPGFGSEQGNYSVIDIGPYDMWAIEYGYTFKDPKKVAERSAERELQYGTDEDSFGPDPTVRRYDMASDPMSFASNQMALAKELRKTMLEHFVKDGDTWSRARRGYRITLGQQTTALSMMANWVGTARVYRDKKGTPDGRPPIDPVDAQTQRDAMQFVIDNAFTDEAFGLTPELLAHMTVDKWWDKGGIRYVAADATYPLHEKILGIQASAITMLLNPQTLGRVYDLEHFIAPDEDALTVPEIMESVSGAIWGELDEAPKKKFSVRKPMISSLRRNLQAEHLGRMIDLSMDEGWNAAGSTIQMLATQQLRDLASKIDSTLENEGKADAYTRAHLNEAKERIARALDAQYIYNASDIGGGGGPVVITFGQDATEDE